MVTGVEFDEDKISYGAMQSAHAPAGAVSGAPAYDPRQYATRARGMSGWLISHGWVKSETAAQGILLGIVLVNIIITYMVIKYVL